MNLAPLLVFIQVVFAVAHQAEYTKSIQKQLHMLQALRSSLLEGCQEEKAYVNAAIAASSDAAALLSGDLVALEAQHASAQANATVVPENFALAEVRVTAAEAAAEPLAVFRELYARRKFREAAEETWLLALNRTCGAALDQVQATEQFVTRGALSKLARARSDHPPDAMVKITVPENPKQKKPAASLMQFSTGVRDVNWTEALLRGCQGLGMMNAGVSSQKEVAEEWQLLTARTRTALSLTRDRLKSNEAEEEQARGHSGAQAFQVLATSGSRWPGAAKLHAFSAETSAAIDVLRSAEAKAISLRADEAQASRRGASVLAASFAAHQQRSVDSNAELNRRHQDFEKEKTFCANRASKAGSHEHVPLAIFTTKSKAVKNIFKPPLDTTTPELLGMKPINERAETGDNAPAKAPAMSKPAPKAPEVAEPVTPAPAPKTLEVSDAPNKYFKYVAPEKSVGDQPSLNQALTGIAVARSKPVAIPNQPVVAPKPTSQKVTTALPQESESADARPEVKPDLSKSPNLNSYLFGDSDGGGDSELSSLISKVHEMEQAPVRHVASSLAAMPVAASPVATPSWAKPMAGDHLPSILSRPSASLMEESNPYAGESSTYTNDPNVLKTLRLGRFGADSEIKSNAKVLADQEWAATEMSDSNSALTGFLEGASGGVRIKPTPVVPHIKKSRKVIIKEDMSALDKIMGKLR